jgi:hypothetical protein
MAIAAELTVQGTGKIETLDADVMRYVLTVTRGSRSGEFGVRAPEKSRNLLKAGKRLTQDAQLWRLIEEFFNKIVESGYTLSDPLPDFVLHEAVARKVLNGGKLSIDDVQNSVVGIREQR